MGGEAVNAVEPLLVTPLKPKEQTEPPHFGESLMDLYDRITQQLGEVNLV